MKEKTKIIEVTLSQESVDAIAEAVTDVMLGLLNDIFIPLRDKLQEIESNISRINSDEDKTMHHRIPQNKSGSKSNVCPNIPDNWRGNRADTARQLGICPKTLDKYARIGRRYGGIDWLPGRRGKIFLGKEIKRFWHVFK